MQATSWFVSLVVTMFVQKSQGMQCDMSTDAVVQDGIMGESDIFCWLGILRVHLHDGDNTKIALTGVVLIKVNFVLANADDIARIPMNVFKEESQIMFIPQHKTPWFCRPLAYTTHPEYEYSTYNTIAVIELALENAETYPLKPICWPKRMTNTSSHLYVTGYTDDNKFLEKMIHKMQFVDKTICEQFYKKAGLSVENRTPLYYQCGLAVNDKENCVWDNGMALVSNVTGWFTLIGLGVRGPGCAAPSRFIDVYEYMQWLDVVTSINEVDDYGDYRRSQKKEGVQYIPAHDLLRNGSELTDTRGTHRHKYPFDVEELRHFNVEQTEPNKFLVTPFDDKYEFKRGMCENRKALAYREHFKVHAKPGETGQASYKLSLYDFALMPITCIKIIADCLERSEATLYYTETTDFQEGTSITDAGETPEHLFRHYLLKERKKKNEAKKKGPGPHLKPEFIQSSFTKLDITSVNLILKFRFNGQMDLKFEMYGEPQPPARVAATPPARRRIFDDIFNDKGVVVIHDNMSVIKIDNINISGQSVKANRTINGSVGVEVSSAAFIFVLGLHMYSVLRSVFRVRANGTRSATRA